MPFFLNNRASSEALLESNHYPGNGREFNFHPTNLPHIVETAFESLKTASLAAQFEELYARIVVDCSKETPEGLHIVTFIIGRPLDFLTALDRFCKNQGMTLVGEAFDISGRPLLSQSHTPGTNLWPPFDARFQLERSTFSCYRLTLPSGVPIR